MKAQQSALTDNDRSASFQSDYSRVQQQFNVAMQQKNKLQADLNMAQRSSSQREARCQQLAMQVSLLPVYHVNKLYIASQLCTTVRKMYVYASES